MCKSGISVSEIISQFKNSGYCKKDGKKFPTGIAELDAKLGGGFSNDFSCITGRPSAGKTALALQIATNLSRLGCHVLYFSTERDSIRLVSRLISRQSYLQNKKSALTSQEVIAENYSGAISEELSTAADQVAEDCKNFTLYDCGSWNHTVEEIEEEVRKYKAEQDDDVFVVVDYLNELRASENHIHDERKDLIDYSVLSLKQLSEALQIPVLLVCAINRDDNYKGPVELYQLKDTGRLEYNLDTVLAIESDSYSSKDGVVNIAILKQKDGEANFRIPSEFHAAYNCFEDITDEDSDNFDFSGLNYNVSLESFEAD